MILELALLALTCFIVWFVLTRRQNLGKRAKLGIDGPPTNFLWGNMHEAKAFMDRVYGTYMGGHLQVVVHDLEMVKEILIKQFPNFTNRMTMPLTNVHPLKDTLVANEGQRWKDVRSVVSPVFSSGKLKRLQYIMDEKMAIFMDVMSEKAADGQSFDIFMNYQGLTLDVIGQAAFAISVDCQRNFADPFYVNCRKFFQENDFGNAGPLMLFSALMMAELDPVLKYLRPFTAMGKSEKVLLDALIPVVKSRMHHYENFKSTDVLQLLVEQSNEDNAINRGAVRLSQDEIVGNCYVFLLAGYETTSTALSLTTWLLAKNPEAQKKLQEEIDAHLPSGECEWDVVGKMPYLDAVFHEALRYFPPITQFVARTCVSATDVCGVHLSAGTEVLVPVYSIHHDPEVWPEPEEFKPERFYKNKDWPAMGWLPFGSGPRNCIGLRFAEMEYKKVLCALLSKYSVVFGEGSDLNLAPVTRGAVMGPEHGIVVRLEKR